MYTGKWAVELQGGKSVTFHDWDQSFTPYDEMRMDSGGTHPIRVTTDPGIVVFRNDKGDCVRAYEVTNLKDWRGILCSTKVPVHVELQTKRLSYAVSHTADERAAILIKLQEHHPSIQVFPKQS